MSKNYLKSGPCKLLKKGDFVESNQIKKLDVRMNKLSVLKWITKLKKLATINASFNNITSIQIKANMSSLRNLNLSENHIRDLRDLGLGRFPGLENLNLESNRLRSVDGISKMSKLQVLNMAQNEIEWLDLEALALSCRRLECLELGRNRIRAVVKKSKKTVVFENLKDLRLGHNSITSLAFLRFCPDLFILDVSHNQMSHFHYF